MTRTSTTAGWALPWDESTGEPGEPGLGVAIAWCLEDPRRVGEVARVDAPTVVGRATAEDGALASFARERPNGAAVGAPLTDARLSRKQLVLTPAGGHRLNVENVGKCPMLVNGSEVTTRVVVPGDTITLKNVLVLLVTLRARPIPLRSYPAKLVFPFGAADAHGMVGESPPAWRLREALASAAGTKDHVLVHGRSGSGKELAARALHALSPRAGRPFLSRNAATFPEGLIDAELFGNVKNYPNPGMPERRGLVGGADTGTLFLDEIGELPPALQAHLLRVLDSGGEYQRLGESRTSRADLRVVAATNRPLSELKHDFIARFATRIEVPTLDERREDVPLLVRRELERRLEASPDVERFFDDGRAGHRAPRIDPALIEALLRHDFSHEHRDLSRLLSLAISTSPGKFIALGPEVAAALRLRSGTEAPAVPAELSRQAIEAALEGHGGNVTSAARALSLKNRFQLYRLLKQHGIERDAAADEPGD